MIDPRCLYMTEECMSLCGIGEEGLAQGRRSGLLTPIMHGRRLYYSGAQLIELVKALGKVKRTRGASVDPVSIRSADAAPPITEANTATADWDKDRHPDRASSARRPVRGNSKGIANAHSHSKAG